MDGTEKVDTGAVEGPEPSGYVDARVPRRWVLVAGIIMAAGWAIMLVLAALGVSSDVGAVPAAAVIAVCVWWRFLYRREVRAERGSRLRLFGQLARVVGRDVKGTLSDDSWDPAKPTIVDSGGRITSPAPYQTASTGWAFRALTRRAFVTWRWNLRCLTYLPIRDALAERRWAQGEGERRLT